MNSFYGPNISFSRTFERSVPNATPRKMLETLQQTLPQLPGHHVFIGYDYSHEKSRPIAHIMVVRGELGDDNISRRAQTLCLKPARRMFDIFPSLLRRKETPVEFAERCAKWVTLPANKL